MRAIEMSLGRKSFIQKDPFLPVQELSASPLRSWMKMMLLKRLEWPKSVLGRFEDTHSTRESKGVNSVGVYRDFRPKSLIGVTTALYHDDQKSQTIVTDGSPPSDVWVGSIPLLKESDHSEEKRHGNGDGKR